VRGALTISRPDQLHAIGEPTRWRILGRLLDGPASIQELARAFGAAKGTIGHHVRVLERAGLIRLAETQRVRGVVEKRYARSARQFRLPDPDDPASANAAGDLGTLPLRQALAEAAPAHGPKDPSTSIVVRARMPASRARRFAALLKQLAAEFADGAPGEGEAFGFVGAIYVPDWSVTDPRPGRRERPPNR
jgi:DNA-binding transcriptional ArsR family regulator